MSRSRDLEILALKAETNRLNLESLLVLGQLEAHQEHLKQFLAKAGGGRRQDDRD